MVKAQEAFELLKKCFLSALVLKMLNPNIPFILEIDSLEVSIGVVLSQRHGTAAKLHPCAFF